MPVPKTSPHRLAGSVNRRGPLKIGLEGLPAANESEQALVILAARWAAGEVFTQTGKRRLGVAAGELELDVLV